MPVPNHNDWMVNPVSARAVRADVRRDFPAAFAPWTENPALPRVLLIGDSISLGYTPFVRELLRATANVHRIPDNGGATTLGLVMLDKWLGPEPWHVIHFNFGLHDITRLPSGTVRTTPDTYAANLRTLVTRLQRTGARLIFATTTPVPGRTINPTRDEADVLAVNARATAVMRELGVTINDLHAFTAPRLAEWQQPANVHFTPAGYAALAEPVAAAIRVAL
ncbi:MAG: SGNH/GDSL hydrolase family protein [Opitutaceae bacterium]|nr:SGNH/GDSL hydrolase family protein [Opitutaceae bacterium]